jgi:hypothetical protein
MEFITLTMVTCIVLVFIVRFTLKTRDPNPAKTPGNVGILIALAVLCMLIGKYGANWGFPWWIYYPAPMLLVLVFPLTFFKMQKKEALIFILISVASGPIIHVVFSLFGWKNYMPFIRIPSIMELLQ